MSANLPASDAPETGACPEVAEPRIAIESLRVKADRVVAMVRVGDARHANTTPQIARAAVDVMPNLPIHTCANGVGPTFGAVLRDTPLPHLLEHIVVELQVAECPDPDRVFTGATRWVDRRAGLAQVEVSYADDLVALRAFRDAVAMVNGFLP